MFRVAAIALCAVLWSGVGRAAAPRIELYTLSAGDDLFGAFGHATICVVDATTPTGRCYNYGTADFSMPLRLSWDFVRGRAQFFVSLRSMPTMLDDFRASDRTVWRQVLALTDAQAEALSQALAASADERVMYYRYNHFTANCTTRIRDVIDHVTGGALRRDPRDRDLSFRQWVRQGFVDNWPMQVVTELILGRPSEHRPDSWQAMFLPSELREEVQARLHSPAEVIYTRRAAPPHGHPWYGRLAFVLAGLVLAASILLGRTLGAGRAALVPTALLLGLTAVVVDVLALLSTLPEFVRNEGVLVFWPTDLTLPFLSARWLRGYATVRIVALVVVAALHLGPFTQPLAPLALCLLPLLAIRRRS